VAQAINGLMLSVLKIPSLSSLIEIDLSSLTTWHARAINGWLMSVLKKELLNPQFIFLN
jgi:hypothetical protein